MKKRSSLLITGLAAAVIIGLVLIIAVTNKQIGQRCGGVAGIPCPKGYECQINANSQIVDDVGVCVRETPEKNRNTTGEESTNNEPVEYNASYGTVCPLKVKFLDSTSANSVGCSCPEGYEFESQIIGYEQCDEENAECPIFSKECVPTKIQEK